MYASIHDYRRDGQPTDKAKNLPPVWDLLLPLAQTPDRRDQRFLLSVSTDTGKVG